MTNNNYKRGNPLLSPAESKFFKFLLTILGGKTKVFSKVRVADVVQVTSSDFPTFDDICRRHFDFVVCRMEDNIPFCVIELNDKRHSDDPKRITSDNIKRVICEESGIPFFAVKCRWAYNKKSMRSLLKFAYIKTRDEIPLNVPIKPHQKRASDLQHEQ